MSQGFDLDLRQAEGEIDDATDLSFDERVVLGVLDGTTPPEEWLDEVRSGAILLLAIDGDLEELASGIAPDVKRRGGSLVHFREFLVVAPSDVDVDTDRLNGS